MKPTLMRLGAFVTAHPDESRVIGRGHWMFGPVFVVLDTKPLLDAVSSGPFAGYRQMTQDEALEMNRVHTERARRIRG